MTTHPTHATPSAAVAVPRAAKATVSATPPSDTTPASSTTINNPQAQEPQPPPPQADAAANGAAFATHHDHWRAQSDHHFAVRKQMIGRLQRLHPLLATNTTMRYGGQFTRIPELVQRLELMLYKAAASLDEYTNVCTLERRVHSLVTLLEPLPPPASASPSSVAGSHKRRASTASASSKPKRRRRSVSAPSAVAVTRSPTSRLTRDLSGDLLAHVFAFVDGLDVLCRCSLVNRFFHREAPRLVSSLTIDVGDASHARVLHGRVAQVLPTCINLTQLTITNSRTIGKKNSFSRSCHGDDHPHTAVEPMAAVVSPPPSFAVPADPQRFTGRVLLHELADLWFHASHRVFPKLRCLEISSPFDCANEAEATLHCLHALATNLSIGNMPLAFDTLVLDTTALGDRRVARLLSLVHAFPKVFMQQLRVLELRNNFVGEAGMAALCCSLARGEWLRLETLGLKRNIITDGDAHQLALCLAQRSEAVDVLPRLARIDLSENFIGKPGFEALACSLHSTRSLRPVEIATALNCMESSEAAHLFM